jgi:hypothetical protein
MIGRSDELRALLLIDLTERGETLGVDRPDAADDARDRLAIEIVALQILRHPVRAHDVVAGGARHAAERQLARPDRTGARLIVPDAGDPIRHFESRLEELLVPGSSAAHGRKRQPVMDRQLKVAGKSAGAALEPDPAGAVLGDAPTASCSARWVLSARRSESSARERRCRCCRASCPGPRTGCSADARRCRTCRSWS